MQKIFTMHLIMAIGLMLIMAGCGGGGSGGSDGSGSTSTVSDSTGTGTDIAESGTLTWDAPSTNENGTVLTDLAGYKVYYGTASGNYTEVKDVGNVTTVSIDELPDIQSGTWYFAVTAYDTSGNESSYSNEVSTKIL